MSAHDHEEEGTDWAVGFLTALALAAGLTGLCLLGLYLASRA